MFQTFTKQETHIPLEGGNLMSMLFNRKSADITWTGTQLSLISLDKTLEPQEVRLLEKRKELWNMYEGYHWENIPTNDKPQITLNYVRRFADKLNYFLFGNGFTISVPSEVENLTLPFLNNVWDAEYNNREKIALMLGQMGGVSGDAYIMPVFEVPGEFPDPYEQYPDGRIRIMVLPSHICFPKYNDLDRSVMDSFEIKYPIQKKEQKALGKVIRTVFGRKYTGRMTTYKQVWTNDTWQEYIGDELVGEGVNSLGIIPIVHIPNIPVATSDFGVSDIEDICPINRELNFKASDISEVIDYHGAPVTVIFGARVNNLERGANKVWGGLPSEARVENLELKGDLGAAVNFFGILKRAMHEIGSVPEASLGSERAVSNTSGVALHIENMPLIEKTSSKTITYGDGLRKLNKLILLLGVRNGLISIPKEIFGMSGVNASGADGNTDIPQSPENMPTTIIGNASSDVSNPDGIITDRTKIRNIFYNVDVKFYNVLPKDELQEIEKIQAEISIGIESRLGAMKRLNKENIQRKLEEIDAERAQMMKEQLTLLQGGLSVRQLDKTTKSKKIISGFNNGPEPKSKIV